MAIDPDEIERLRASTQQAKPAGMRRPPQPTAVGPGYDQNPAIRGAQAADDVAMQKKAAAPAAAPGYDQNPSIRNAQAAADSGAQAKAVGELTAASGNNAARAGRMQAQANMPVAGPRNPSPAYPVSGQVERDQVASVEKGPDPLAQAGAIHAYEVADRAVAAGLTPPTGGAGSAGAPAAEQAAPTVAENFGRGLRGAGKSALGAAAYPHLAVYDGVRNLAGSRADGDTSQIKQYSDGAAQVFSEGVSDMQGAAAGLRQSSAVATRSALGIDQAPPVAATEAAPASAKPSGANQAGYSDEALAGMKPPAGAAAPQAAPPAGNGYTRTGIGVDRQGGEIVMRQGADGVPEFTNAKAAQDGASAMPPGGFGARMQRPAQSAMPVPPGARPLAAGSNEPDGNADLASLGSAANVGNGVGTFSQMPAGSSQEAMARFERANQIRREQLAESGGIQVGGIRGKMSLDDALQDKLGMRNRALDIEQQANQAELGLRGRELDAQLDRQGIEAQGAQQDLELGEIKLSQARRDSDLLARIQDPNTPAEEREQLTQQYRALTTAGKDRYFIQDSVIGYDAAGAPIVGKQVLDSATGKVLGGGEAGAAAAPKQYKKGDVAVDKTTGARRVYQGKDAQGQDIWEKV